MQELLKRFELIKTCISLEDHTIIDLQLPLLKELTVSSASDAIILLLERQLYIDAQQAIEYFIKSQHGLISYEDAQITAIRLELKTLEQRLQNLIAHRNDAQNSLQDFNREYHLNLGPVVLRVLSLQEQITAQALAIKLKSYRSLEAQFKDINTQIKNKKEHINQVEQEIEAVDFLSDAYDELISELMFLKQELGVLEAELEEVRLQAKAELQSVKKDDDGIFQQHQEAQQDSDSFEYEYEEIKSSVTTKLDADEKQLLKKLYRKISKLCHPDIVSDELKDKAHELMVAVNVAYQEQDLNRLKELLIQIENGGELTCISDVIADKEFLLQKLKELKELYQRTLDEVQVLENSDSYQTIIQMGDDLEGYFAEQQHELEQFSQALEQELAQLKESEDMAATV